MKSNELEVEDRKSNILKQRVLSSVAQSCPTLRPHGLQHASPTAGVYSNACPLSQ